MQATQDTIIPKYQKTGLRTVGGVAFRVTLVKNEVFRSQFCR